MRVVVDTNVFVAAILSANGASRQVLRDCLQEKCIPVMGQALFSEYESLLRRDVVFKDSPLGESERSDLLQAFLSVCQWITIYFLWRPNLPDEADNHIVELALAAGATHIVTHNVRDFVHAELRFPRLRIVTPAGFLQENA